MFGRNRFGDLIARQLDIFGEENAELLVEIGEYRERWRRASREGAEEAFGDEQDRVDWAAEALVGALRPLRGDARRGDGGGVPPRLREGGAAPLPDPGRDLRGPDRHRVMSPHDRGHARSGSDPSSSGLTLGAQA